MIVERITALKTEVGVSCRAQCRACGLAYSSLMRWKGRRRRGEPVVRPPGPAKLQPLDVAHLEEEIRALGHCRKRSAGAGALRRRYKDQISRRQIQRMIVQVRSRQKRRQRDALQHLTWRRAGLVWSMDDMEFDPGAPESKIHVHAVEDLGSRYKFPPLTGKRLAGGSAVADHLAALFRRYGPPLFLKRDNHGNLNDHQVDAVMNSHRVLPLNSPCYYPRYNGAMERAQRELREELGSRLEGLAPAMAAATVLEAAIQELNHQPRPCLNGQTSCAVFSLGLQEARTYTSRKRTEVSHWITSLAVHIMAQDNGATPLSAAQSWRIAAQIWLQRHGVISIARKKKCHPVS